MTLSTDIVIWTGILVVVARVIGRDVRTVDVSARVR